MRDLQNRLEATPTWDLVEQMKVAQQYFKVSYQHAIQQRHELHAS